MMNDTELFELCKEVYEKVSAFDYVFNESLSHYLWVEAHQEYELDNGSYSNDEHPPIPLYTSDYLLEKLPQNVMGGHIALQPYMELSDTWNATVIDWNTANHLQNHHADTPLKALLKLTIALHNAGHLNSPEIPDSSNVSREDNHEQ